METGEMTNVVIGLLDKTQKLDPQLVSETAAALNAQVTEHLTQFWPVTATVKKLNNPKCIPVGVWPVYLVEKLPPGEGGFHLNKHNQPYAEVIATPEGDGWTVAASHEVIEMLVDPYGNRLQAASAIEIEDGKIVRGLGRFEYLVEACDPCEADPYAYPIAGISLSDFITPRFYDSSTTPGTRYSYTGAIQAPLQILPGGYISWVDPARDEWQQLQYLDPASPPKIVDLGPASGNSMREWVHTKNAAAGLADTRALSQAEGSDWLRHYRDQLRVAAAFRAEAYTDRPR
jgi:hypothetical protein